jgi:hypothetical protein
MSLAFIKPIAAEAFWPQSAPVLSRDIDSQGNRFFLHFIHALICSEYKYEKI